MEVCVQVGVIVVLCLTQNYLLTLDIKQAGCQFEQGEI
jgi:hypothetical protein